MPFGFLKRRQPAPPAPGAADRGPAVAGEGPPAGSQAAQQTMAKAEIESELLDIRLGPKRPFSFTALTEDWRLEGDMMIRGRLSDALNKREAITIAEVRWGPPDAPELDPAPGLKSVDPYDLILVTSGPDSLPPLSDEERAALRVHKVPFDLALEVPPFRVMGTVWLSPGMEPESLLLRATEMFLPVCDALAKLDSSVISGPGTDVILVNRYYLRGVAYVDRESGQVIAKGPGKPAAGE